MQWLEWFGYFASVVIAVSLMMSSIVKLRWVNLTGAALFSLYGLLIDALPVAVLNGFIVLVNLYHLYGIYRRKEQFRLVPAALDDPLMQYWLDYYGKDMNRYFPGVELSKRRNRECHVMLRNGLPVGLLAGRQLDDAFEVDMDYAFPAYQDFRTGEFLYLESGFFSKRGIRKVFARVNSDRHQAYLERMGFERRTEGEDIFEFQLKPP